MASIWEWQNDPNVIRIQNKNYVGEAIGHFYNNWFANEGCLPNQWKSRIRGYNVIDNSVRIPGHIAFSGYSFSGQYFVNQGFDTQAGGNAEYSGQGMLGDNRYSPNTADILDYIPRLYVELTSFPNFVNVLTSRGETAYWTLDFLFNTYGEKTIGYHWQPASFGMLSTGYVLTYAAIYTNKKDGTPQNLLSEYSPGTSSLSRLYDMYIPLDPIGYNWSGRGYKCVVPYIYNFMAHHLGGGNNSFYYGAKWAGKAGGLMGVKYCLSSAVGSIIDNPFMVYGNMDTRAFPYLTTYPGGTTTVFPIASMTEWKKIFSGSGMEWSFNRDDVIAPGDDKLNKPTFPGQPDNPTGGGGGDGDNISDDIPLPDVKFFPNNNSYNRYWLTPAQLPELQNWIFNKTFFDNILRLWNDPAEYLINLTFYPFNGYLHDVANVNPEAKLSIGNLSSEITCISMLDGYNPVFQGGTYTVTEYYGTYLDYAPYTTAEIYIPYIGYRNLNINDIMGKTLSLRYVVDWDTNNITATILVNDTPLTMYSGSFGVKLALSGTNANQLAETITQGAISTVVSMAGVVGSVAGTVAAGATGNIPGAIQGAAQTSQSIGGAVGGVVDTVMNTQVHPRYYGQPTPATGLYNTQVPHIIFHRPITAEPLEYRSLHGYAAGYSGKVSEFSGYLQCKEIQLGANTTISAAEQTEIINLMKGGIFA